MAAASLYLFEDEAVAGLEPLCDTRPAFELRCGALNLRERLELAAPGWPRHAHVREPLRALLSQTLPEFESVQGTDPHAPVLLVNARAQGSVGSWRAVCENSVAPRARRVGRTLIFAHTILERAEAFLAGTDDLSDLPTDDAPYGLELLDRIWDLPHRNGQALCDDHRDLADVDLPARRIFGVDFEEGFAGASLLAPSSFGSSERAILYPGVHVIEDANVLYGPGAKIRPGAILDAERGPILLGAGCVIHPQAVVVGPAYIGPGSVVNPGAKLREGTSLGAFCKVGGEVEEAILHDLSNKQHDGFLGHAVLGSWVNLGADTNGSDLKNNYGNVRVLLAEGTVDSGQRFVGPMMGDHVKTGINTMLSTGTVIGAGANVFGAGFPPRRIPAFTWGGAEGLVEYEIERALQTAKVVFGRRGARWTPSHGALLHEVFTRTAGERASLR